MAGPGLRFQGNLPRLPNLTWEGSKRALWLYLSKIGAANSSLQTFIDFTFGSLGGALQALLTVKGSLITYDGTGYAALTPGANWDVLHPDSTAALGLRWRPAIGLANRRLTVDMILADGFSGVASGYYDIGAGVVLDLQGDATMEIL